MRIDLLSKDAAWLIPFAKKKLAEIVRIRLSGGPQHSRKTYRIGEFIVEIIGNPAGDRIRLHGSVGFDHIVFSDGNSLYGFNWTKNVLERRLGNGGDLSQGNARKLDTQAATFTCRDGKITKGILRAEGFNYSEPMFLYDTVVYVSGSLVSVKATRDGVDVLYPVASTEITQPGKPTSHFWYAGLVGDNTTEWNLLGTKELWLIDIRYPDLSMSPAWRWTPRLWNPETANYLSLRQGMYYGTIFDFWGPFRRILVDFGCVLNHRDGSDVFGYAEVLKKTEDPLAEEESGPGGDHLKAFFFLSLWEAPKNFYYAYTGGFSKIRFFQHNYWYSCPLHDFRIDYDSIFTEAAKHSTLYLDWWSATDIPAPPLDLWGLPRKLSGVVAYSGTGEFACHRVIGIQNPNAQGYAPSKIISGRGYIDHSYSYDGRIVSILYTDDEGKDRVFVFDLYENVEIINSTAPAGKNFRHGQIIPVRPKDRPPADYQAPSGPVPVPRSPDKNKDYEISMFGMRHPYPVTDGYSASGWSVKIESGTAEGFLWADECWQHAEYRQLSLPAENPPSMDELQSLIMYNYDPDVPGASVAGTGQKSISKTIGVTAGTGPGSTIIKRAPISIAPGTEMITGCLIASKNAKSPLTWGGDVAEDAQWGCYKPVPGCTDTEDGKPAGVVELTDDCGETADPVEFPFDALEVTGTDTPVIGSRYSASGGTAPYSFSGTGLTLTEDGEVTAFGECAGPGELRTGKVKATDSCGRTSEMTVRLPGGAWIQVEVGDCDRFWADGYVSLTFISGGTKMVKQYQHSGCECFGQVYQTVGSCRKYNQYTCSGSGYAFYRADDTWFDGVPECDPVSPSVGLESLNYDARTDVGYAGDVPMGFCSTNEGNSYAWYGWRLFDWNPNCYTKYEWQCP